MLEPPKSGTGLNVKFKWPSRFLFGEGFRFSIFSMPWFQAMQPGRAAQELIARVVHSLALVSADVSLQEALRSQGQRKLQFH